MGGMRMVHRSLRGIVGDGVATASCRIRGPCRAATEAFCRPRPIQRPIATSVGGVAWRSSFALAGPSIATSPPWQRSHWSQLCHRHPMRRDAQFLPTVFALETNREFSSRRNPRNSKKKVDPNAPLLNEHLIAQLFKMKKRESVSADTYEVRLIVDQGRKKKKSDDADETDDNDDASSPSTPTTQITTVNKAITIAHELALDLMEVTLKQNPPVIKAVDFDKHLYEQKKKERQSASKKKREGGGAISDRPLKEFKFRAGIDDHDLQRKTNNMIGYLEKGHAVRVTLTARMRMLRADENAMETTLGRVKELVGDRAVEVRGLKANERKSYGSLLLHPSKKGGN